MHKNTLDLATRIERLVKFLYLLEQGNQTKAAAKVCFVPACSLRVLVEQKFVETTGVNVRVRQQIGQIRSL